MTGNISLHGRLEMYKGDLVIRIPLEVGGDQLAPFAKGIGTVEDGFLTVVIQPWLAEKLRVSDGSWVYVDNNDRKFTITRSAANDE